MNGLPRKDETRQYIGCSGSRLNLRDILRNGERWSANPRAEPNTMELVWIVPEAEKKYQETARDEKMLLISPGLYNFSDDHQPRWRFAR